MFAAFKLLPTENYRFLHLFMYFHELTIKRRFDFDSYTVYSNNALKLGYNFPSRPL